MPKSLSSPMRSKSLDAFHQAVSPQFDHSGRSRRAACAAASTPLEIEIRRWWRRLTPAGENIENDVGGMDALAQRFGAGGLHGGQPVVEHGGQNS